MVGNGVTNWTYDTMPATTDMGYWHSIMSQDIHDKMTQEECDYSGIVFNDFPSDSCMNYLDQFQTGIENVNIYNIYGDCYGGVTEEEEYEEEEEVSTMQVVGRRILEAVTGHKKTKKVKQGFTAKDYTPWLFKNNRRDDKPRVKGSLGELPPCTFGIPLINWANNATVRKQLHIPDYV